MTLFQKLHPYKLACLKAALHDTGLSAHFKKDTILITGARGYFGRYLTEAFLLMNELFGTDITVLALDSDATGTDDKWDDWRNVSPNLHTFRHNVKHDLGTLAGFRPTRIFHLAGIASPYWYKKLPLETVHVAVKGTEQMLQLAREFGAKLLFTSSSEVYQTASVVPTPETFVGAIPSCSDRSCYDVSKLLAETLCYIYATQHKVHSTVVRIFNSFGPGMAQSDRRILTRLASALKSEQEAQVYVSRIETPTRTYTPVANTLRGVLYAAAYGESVGATSHRDAAGIYNVGNDKPELSVRQLIEAVYKSTGWNLAFKEVQAPQEYETEPLRRCPDIRRLRALGYTEAMSLEDGLKLFFQWSQEAYKSEAK